MYVCWGSEKGVLGRGKGWGVRGGVIVALELNMKMKTQQRGVSTSRLAFTYSILMSHLFTISLSNYMPCVLNQIYRVTM